MAQQHPFLVAQSATPRSIERMSPIALFVNHIVFKADECS
jgi:hypothetical protein